MKFEIGRGASGSAAATYKLFLTLTTEGWHMDKIFTQIFEFFSSKL
jgi:hypothetical protein